MDRQYMPYWPSGQGQYPPVKEEPDFSKMGYEDTPGSTFNIKREPDAGPRTPSMGYSANVKVEPPEVKQELVEPKQEPPEERRGEKRQAPTDYEPPPDTKRYRPEMSDGQADNDPEYDKEAVILDWYNSDLSLVIDKESFLSAEPMTSEGFAYIWHGVRATYGFLQGRLFFEVKVLDYIPVPHLEEEQHPHVIRCGWSSDDAGLTLGEEPFSYGYGGTGKASTDLKFKDYGPAFGKGDIVGCFLDMDSEPIMMSFTVNGRSHGKCFEVSHRSLQGKALFPHILTKNCTFKVNFGSEYPWFQPLVRYTYVAQVPLQDRVLGTQGPKTRPDSEVIMMVGLPACGKTTWVEKYCKEHAQKKYYVLGTNFLIEKMKVNGLSRKRNYHGRWDVLIERCTKCLNSLLGMSYKRKRNYIIDQTNVYPSARKRKMKGYPGFYRRAMVLCPSDADQQERTAKQIRQEGKNVPDSAILEMKANFTVPEESDGIFDSVEFAELQRDEATKVIEQYSKEAQDAGFVKKGPYRGGGRGGGNFRGGWNRDRSANSSRGSYNRDSSNNQSSGFGRDNRGSFARGGNDRGGFGSRGGFERGGGDSSRGSFDRRGDGGRGGFGRGGDGSRGGFGRGTDSSWGGYGRGGDGTRGGYARGNFGNRDGSRGYSTDRDNQSYDSNPGFKRDSDRDNSREQGGGDWNAGSRDFDRSGDSSRGRFGQDRNKDSQRGFDSERNNREGDGYNSGGFGQNNFGGNRDMERSSNRNFGRGSDSSRSGSYARDSSGSGNRDMDRGYGQDNSGANDNMRGNFGRDSQRSVDRDYSRGGGSSSSDNFGSSNRSYSLDRDRDSRSDGGDSYGQSGYGGGNRDMQRGFGGSHDNLSRNMRNQAGVVGGGGGGSSSSASGYSNQEPSDSSGYSSLSSSSGSLPTGQNFGQDWSRQQYNSQPPQPQWGQNNGGFGNPPPAAGPGQQAYGRPFDRSSSPGGGGGGSSGWAQQGGSGTYGSTPGGGQQPWNYGSSYGQRQ